MKNVSMILLIVATSVVGQQSDLIGDPKPSVPSQPRQATPSVVQSEPTFPALNLPPAVDTAAIASAVTSAVSDSVNRRLDSDRSELVGAIRDLGKQIHQAQSQVRSQDQFQDHSREQVQAKFGCMNCPGPDVCNCPCKSVNQTVKGGIPKLHFAKDSSGHWWYGTDPEEVRSHVAKVNSSMQVTRTTALTRTNAYTEVPMISAPMISAPVTYAVPEYSSLIYSSPMVSSPMFSGPLLGGIFSGGGCAGGSCR